MSKGKNTLSLPGKIAVNLEDSFFIYDNSSMSKIKFKIKNDEKISYAGFNWINKGNNFIGVEYLQTPATGINQGNVVCFDLSGNIVKRVYESLDGEIAEDAYLSRNDKRLLFTTIRKGNANINPLEGLNPVLSLVIMDFNKKEVIEKIKNVGTSLSFELHESPWLFDENRFIYSISGEKKITVEGINADSPQKDELGIYVYDLTVNQKKMLIPEARFGICSPVDLHVSYIKGQSVWVIDLKDNSTKNVFQVGPKDRIGNIHWTPDGKYIYIAYINYSNPTGPEPEEKLIEVRTSKEVFFEKIEHGFHSYSWK
ncbi:MAG TPA: hypothetical protein VK483_05270 [Chitinophagaceae bacterium]|nr:hypothetical protein [Chitinophagaceae bacterium]